jgi:hypothetical protein
MLTPNVDMRLVNRGSPLLLEPSVGVVLPRFFLRRIFSPASKHITQDISKTSTTVWLRSSQEAAPSCLIAMVCMGVW